MQLEINYHFFLYNGQQGHKQRHLNVIVLNRFGSVADPVLIDLGFDTWQWVFWTLCRSSTSEVKVMR